MIRIEPDSTGGFWLEGYFDAYHFDSSGGFLEKRAPEDLPAELRGPDNKFWRPMRGPNGENWIFQELGADRAMIYEQKNGLWRWAFNDGPFERATCGQDAAGNFWAVAFGEILRYDGQNWQKTRLADLPGLPSTAKISLLKVGGGGHIWLGLDSLGRGPKLFEIAENSVTHWPLAASPVASLTVRDVFIDDENRKWLATLFGGQRLEGDVWTDFEIAAFGKNAPIAGFRKGPDGLIWAFSNVGQDPARLGGIARRTADGKWEAIADAPKFINQIVWDDAGTLWAAGAGSGLHRLENGVWRTWTFSADGLPTNGWSKIAIGPTGRPTSIGFQGVGLYEFDGNDWEPIFFWPDFWSIGSIGSLMVTDGAGNLFIAHGQTIMKYGLAGWELLDSLPQNMVSQTAGLQLWPKPDGSIWISSNELGLGRRDPASGDWAFWNLQNSPITGAAFDVESDADGNIWIAHGIEGLSVFNENGLKNVPTPVPQPILTLPRLIVDPGPTASAELAILPNPTSGAARIIWQNPLKQASEISIFDRAGRLVSKSETVENNLEIDLKSQQGGLFFVEVRVGGKRKASGRLFKF